MSIAPPDTTLTLTQPTNRGPAPPSHPRLPIVEFHTEPWYLNVHFSADEGMQAAVDEPTAVFFDVRGASLLLVEEQDGSTRLVAVSDGDEAELRRRVLAAVRAAAEHYYGGGRLPKDVTAILNWWAAAPDLMLLLQGLGLCPIRDNLPHGKYCNKCSWLQTAVGVHGCCPK
jgi:hypothetical protein